MGYIENTEGLSINTIFGTSYTSFSQSLLRGPLVIRQTSSIQINILCFAQQSNIFGGPQAKKV
jgi:hypothetical protein